MGYSGYRASWSRNQYYILVMESVLYPGPGTSIIFWSWYQDYILVTAPVLYPAHVTRIISWSRNQYDILAPALVIYPDQAPLLRPVYGTIIASYYILDTDPVLYPGHGPSFTSWSRHQHYDSRQDHQQCNVDTKSVVHIF